MKKSMIIILAVAVMGLSLMPVGTALGGQRVQIPYVTQGNGWYTGVAITNFTSDTIHPYADFIHEDGTYSGAIDRVNLGEFARYEMKVYSLYELYNVDKDPAVPLPDDRFSLWITHWQATNEQFGVAVFICNDLAGIGGYGFQQFYPETF